MCGDKQKRKKSERRVPIVTHGAKDGLANDGEVGKVCLLAHFSFLESMFHLESKTIALLVSFALFKSGLDLWCRNLFRYLRHHVIETRPA